MKKPYPSSRYPERPWVKLYKTAAWKKLRESHLRKNPLCVMCLPKTVTEGNTVDHIIPHKGDHALFSDPANLQTLCKTHHSSTKQRLEKSGEFGCDESGIVPAWK